MSFALLAIIIAVVIVSIYVAIVAIALLALRGRGIGRNYEPPEKSFGNQGERQAALAIGKLLNSDEYHFTNVEISADEQRTELDNVIVNKFGVFIIEVKSFSGTLEGDVDAREWEKYHVSGAGNLYSKKVNNPIKQVKRQVYILHKYLEEREIKAWVRGYIVLMHGKSNVSSEYILSSVGEVADVIRKPARRFLTEKEIQKTVICLGENKKEM